MVLTGCVDGVSNECFGRAKVEKESKMVVLCKKKSVKSMSCQVLPSKRRMDSIAC